MSGARFGLVKYSTQASLSLPASWISEGSRIIRRDPVTDCVILNDKIKPFLKLQPEISKFDVAFDAITGGLLKNLNWTNVFVAGGIVLSALQCTQLDKDLPKYKNSDIDMYIFGLGPMGANKKVRHVYQTWKSNLPEGAQSRVLRNSRTITYFWILFLCRCFTTC